MISGCEECHYARLQQGGVQILIRAMRAKRSGQIVDFVPLYSSKYPGVIDTILLDKAA